MLGGSEALHSEVFRSEENEREFVVPAGDEYLRYYALLLGHPIFALASKFCHFSPMIRSMTLQSLLRHLKRKSLMSLQVARRIHTRPDFCDGAQAQEARG